MRRFLRHFWFFGLLLLMPTVLRADLDQTQCGKVAKLVAIFLQQAHFSQKPFDEHVSEIFLRNYLDALDFNHTIFLQSDIDEFEKKYGATLGDYTRREDISPALDIYNRFLTRAAEQEHGVESLLSEPHDFSKDETYRPDRSKLPWPKDEADARALWKKRVKYELLQGLLAKENPSQTRKTIARRYSRFLKEMREADTEEILDYYLNALAHAYDPHSDYQSPSEAENFEINSIKLSLTGIGAVLKSEDGYPKIVSLVPGAPADLDKRLKPNDRIVAVQQDHGEPVDVVDMKLNKVVEQIRGERGTKVTLLVIPADATDESVRRSITLSRDVVKLTEQHAKAFVYERPAAQGNPAERLGVVQLPGFYEKCSEDVALLLKRLEKERVSGVVLDLRRNGGGMLEEAINLSGLFLRDGPVVQVKDYRGRTQSFRMTGNHLCYTGPLLVLVSRFSASASEIVAAALQDYGRAVVIGDQTTHGKGTVQTLLPLSDYVPWDFHGDPGKLKVTVQKFYRVTGLSTQQRGVASDVVLPSIDDYLELGESSLPHALPADAIPPAYFQKASGEAAFLPVLQKRSSERVASNPDFAYVLTQIDLIKRKNEDKAISLNQSVRLKEKQEAEANKTALEAKRAHRPAANENVYYLDIDSARSHKPLKLLPRSTAKTSAAEAAGDGSAVRELEEKSWDEGSPQVGNDFTLEEALNILGDYVTLLQKPGSTLALQKDH
ncbi:carboxy terminal-processing peptidase [Methylacidimicrobium tartarophylax]|uniref:Carboxyl-terminal processing protease n=1 Tax=Methylacidimicrobium tartarophylax TaxID=1041768 RepID=A0A5E6M9X4_9BACT|nr:carboxy terminal-processing peptidase [Methylacidimicrobium tartarophylax]VVM04553.1 carboxyl-terminal processing protease [Methylacidimicrobium tartarophylax]